MVAIWPRKMQVAWNKTLPKSHCKIMHNYPANKLKNGHMFYLPWFFLKILETKNLSSNPVSTPFVLEILKGFLRLGQVLFGLSSPLSKRKSPSRVVNIPLVGPQKPMKNEGNLIIILRNMGYNPWKWGLWLPIVDTAWICSLWGVNIDPFVKNRAGNFRLRKTNRR